jgi:heme oxygenase
MKTVEPVMGELKRRTQDCHQAVERELALEQAVASIAGYQCVLLKFLAIYLAFEPQLMAMQGLMQWLPDLWQRRRIPHLVADLRDLDSPAVATPACIPAEIHHVPEALGCLYVLEGSTLGGRIIARHVAERLNLRPDHGCRFFSGGGRDIGALWRSFSSSMERFATAEPLSRERMVQSALATFAVIRSTFASPVAQHSIAGGD